ncbi:ASST-domain-containing protein [Hyaloraphidium curvatum]|nr:ASST-domain-containing protein [Hyaloraphidium curvatum]
MSFGAAASRAAFALALFLLSPESGALAAGWYRSRPDLAPPRLNITVPASPGVGEGLIFVAPYGGFAPGDRGPPQAGAHIFRDDGELVWSGLGHIAGWAANFRPDVYQGRPVLRAWQGQLDIEHVRFYGDYVILDEHYDVVKTVKPGNNRLGAVHEFRILDGKTVLVETPLPRFVGLQRWGGKPGQDWIISSGFQELDLETGEVLFEWESLDHVDPAYTALPLSETGEGFGRDSLDAWNYFHINSVDKDARGNYLISARNYAAVFKIDGRTGKVLWQLGGSSNRSDFALDPEAEFAFQHDARFVSRSDDGTVEVISLFDNAAHTRRDKVRPSSRALILRLDQASRTARAIASFPAPGGLVAPSQGNVQLLPGGTVFVNWGQAGAVTEFDRSGNVLFHAHLDSHPGRGVQSYRGFRFPWTGRPGGKPAAAAIRGRDGLGLYASWNGDTEAVAWRFFARGSGGAGGQVLLGEATRDGFETCLVLPLAEAPGAGAGVHAEAVGKNGEVLGRSRDVRVEELPTFRHGRYGRMGSGQDSRQRVIGRK